MWAMCRSCVHAEMDGYISEMFTWYQLLPLHCRFSVKTGVYDIMVIKTTVATCYVLCNTQDNNFKETFMPREACNIFNIMELFFKQM